MKIFKRIFGFIFSRAFFTALLILLEIAVISLVLVSGIQNSYVLYVILAIYLIIILHIINKDCEPEFLISWLIVVCLLPPFGGLIYVLFHNSYFSKKEKASFNNVITELSLTIRSMPNYNYVELEKKLKKEDKIAYRQYSYINQVCNTRLYENTDVNYYPMGEEVFSQLIKDLKLAKRFIFMEYFIIREGVMWNTILDILKEKASQGVEVRVVYDDVGSISSLPVNYCKKLKKFNIQACRFNKVTPVVSFVHNNRDHRKITVIDGEVGYVGGFNLSDEYINKWNRFGVWKDSAFRLHGDGVMDLTAIFFSTWDTVNATVSEYGKYLSKTTEVMGSGYVASYADGPEPLYKNKIGKGVYINLINSATDYVYITTPYLIVDFELRDCIKLACQRGVDVRIITPHIPDKKIIHLMTRSSYSELIEAGCRVYEYTPGFIHAKNVVADDKYSVCGTINFDYRSLVHHYECATWVCGEEIARAMKADFNNTLKESEEIDAAKARLKPFHKLLKNILQIFAPLL